MNILITSASRKVWLVRAFQEALRMRSGTGRVLTADMDPWSAALYISDGHVLLPKISDESYVGTIMEICEREDVKLVVPTRDEELRVFSGQREYFSKRGVSVMVSDQAAIATCRDKYQFHGFLKAASFPALGSWLPGQEPLTSLPYPLCVKTRFGSGSKHVFKAEDPLEAEFYAARVPDPMAQEFLQGKEYTVDVFVTRGGKVISAVVRERVEIVAGESYKSITVKDDRIQAQAVALVERLGLAGHVTAQCIKSERGIFFIEINPRFGGGASLGFKAGAHTPCFLLQELAGEAFAGPLVAYEEGLVLLKYTSDFFLRADGISGN